MKTPRLVCVTWLDAHGAARPTDVYSQSEVPHKSAPVETVGFLIKDDADGVSLAGERFPETDEVRNYTFIPKGMVQSVVTLTPEGVRRRRTKAPAPHRPVGRDQPSQSTENPD